MSGGLTHANNFFVVPIPEMVVNCISLRPWAHLLGTGRDVVDISPPALRHLAVSPTHSWGVVERVGRLASVHVSGKVEFGDNKGEFESLMIEVIVGWEKEHPFP